ncbi:hypothetical protein OZD61_02105, partial [Wolbachia endosymbiont of Drosophila bocki]|uniref:hypothetical protein n=1 Tax=Wolbachia endosymbiont of Drosophila leontia TaxID=3002580 RepID=UPI0023A9E5E4
MHKNRKKFGVFYNAALTDNCASQCPLLVIRVADTGSLYDGVMKVASFPCHPSAQTLGWLCCIATYERLTII